MTFSIVIPTYNGALFIEQAIQSALNQTRKADQIIISDDNSTDATLEICKKYQDRIIIHRNSEGPSGFVNGWNKAISLATCDYISILHQDDLLQPCFLEAVEQALRLNSDVRHLFVPCNYIDGKGLQIWEPDYCDGSVRRYSGRDYVHAYQTIGHPHIHRCPGVVTHRRIFDLCKYRTEAGHIADDDFFYRVGQYTDIIGIMQPLASYRLHDLSETGHLKDIELIVRLAKDYIFQIEQWKEGGGGKFIQDDNFNFFRDKALYFSFQEYYYGLRTGDRSLLINGKKHIRMLKNEGYRLPLKKRLFYFITSLFY